MTTATAATADPGAVCRAGRVGGTLPPMPMDPDELARCLDALPWSRRELARRLGCDDATLRRMARGARPVADNLAAWLRLLAALHAALPANLREVAKAIGCDRGRFVRRPRGMRPLDGEEAALLETLAALHAAVPLPIGWQLGRADADAPPEE